MVNKLCLTAISALLLFAPGTYAQQAQTQEPDSVVRETEAKGLLKGAVYRAWRRLRSLSPKSEENRNQRITLTATAGIRGAEQTETLLKPYWKDDRTQSPAYLAQLQAYGNAQNLIEAGRFKEAVVALDALIKEHPDSELLPNAWFAKGLALGAGNDIEGATQALNTFIKGYPGHPMKADAEQVIASFKN